MTCLPVASPLSISSPLPYILKCADKPSAAADWLLQALIDYKLEREAQRDHTSRLFLLETRPRASWNVLTLAFKFMRSPLNFQ